ncbi:MAG TPA: DUF6046 domain-containing protein [Bacteroidia bacterium]|jgi:hypothetical protein|nr:DUF6046 domain-containing protein [Bacteroidia bacterium]
MSGGGKFILSQAPQGQLFSSKIAAAHNLKALTAKFFKAPLTGLPDLPDKITTIEPNFLINALVYDSVTFMGNGADGALSYFDENKGQTITVPKMQIPIALCTVTKNIKVVTTDIAGRNGTIKQYINTGDYEIVIRGIFTTGVSDKYPTEAMKHLQQITNATSEVKVVSEFLHLFDINYLVFTKCEFEQGEDEGRDMQKFTLSCMSETPFTIKVTQPNADITTSRGRSSFQNDPTNSFA